MSTDDGHMDGQLQSVQTVSYKSDLEEQGLLTSAQRRTLRIFWKMN